MGRSLTNAVFNLGLEGPYGEAVKVREEGWMERVNLLARARAAATLPLRLSQRAHSHPLSLLFLPPFL